MRKITVTYFDRNKHQQQTEVFGLINPAIRFARALEKSEEYRIVQVWDVYRNKAIDFETAPMEIWDRTDTGRVYTPIGLVSAHGRRQRGEITMLSNCARRYKPSSGHILHPCTGGPYCDGKCKPKIGV